MGEDLNAGAQLKIYNGVSNLLLLIHAKILIGTFLRCTDTHLYKKFKKTICEAIISV